MQFVTALDAKENIIFWYPTVDDDIPNELTFPSNISILLFADDSVHVHLFLRFLQALHNQSHLHLHVGLGQSLFAGGSKFDNNVAAMPSLHGAYPMLICLFFWKDSSPRKRVLLAAYPICMAFTLVYTAEHFVIDIFVGWAYAAATFYFGSKLLDRWEARRMRKSLEKSDGSEALDSLTPDAPLITSS